MNFEITIASGIFLLGILLGMLLLKLNARKHPPRTKGEFGKPYTGGEEIPYAEMQPGSENYYFAFRSVCRKLSELHTGDISDYLAWMLLALVLVTMVMLGGAL